MGNETIQLFHVEPQHFILDVKWHDKLATAAVRDKTIFSDLPSFIANRCHWVFGQYIMSTHEDSSFAGRSPCSFATDWKCPQKTWFQRIEEDTGMNNLDLQAERRQQSCQTASITFNLLKKTVDALLAHWCKSVDCSLWRLLRPRLVSSSSEWVWLKHVIALLSAGSMWHITTGCGNISLFPTSSFDVD